MHFVLTAKNQVLIIKMKKEFKMSTKNYSAKIFVSLLIIIILTMIGNIAQATPPTPPAELNILDREAIAKLELENGAFRIPVRIRVNEDVSKLVIQVRIFSTDPIKPVQLDESKYSVNMNEKSRKLEIKVPQLRKVTRSKVVIELVGEVGEKRGVLDRKVLFQVIGHDRQQLMTPSQMRQQDQKQRDEMFFDRLRKFPDRPDIRLLAPDTMRVPDTLSEKAKQMTDRPLLQVRGKGPSEKIRRYVVDHAGKSWSPVDPITVRGRLTYLDFEGTWRPLVNASVNLYDDDTFGDEHLGTTTTNWNGEWSFSVNNDDGWLQNGRDIYYRFHLGNTRWDVHDSGGSQYVWQSAVHNDLSDGAVVDYGNETGSTDPTAMQVFGIINLGWNHITSVGGQDPGYIEVRHPTSSSFHSGGVVNIAGSDNDGPDVILHEYGHGLMYRAFGNTGISPGGPHGFGDDLQDSGLAYSEGWATGFMLSLCPDGEYNWHEGTNEGSGEWPACTSQNDFGREIERFSDGGNREGERNEGRVAAVINDFRDFPNDDNGGSENRGRNGEEDANSGNRISLATIYRDSMWGFVHDDFLEFWVTFAGNLSGTTRARADDIMQYNWMSVPIEVSCVASKVTASLKKEPEPLLNGLRAFRDHALKPIPSGRRWIQTYYNHSPELAMLLIADAKARRSALLVIEHFSRLGRAFSQHQELERLIDQNQQILPRDIASAIERIASLIEKKGSAELRRELGALRHELKSIAGMSLADAIARAEGDTRDATEGVLPIIRPHAFGSASKKANWKVIRKNLPTTQGNK
jgi:hypothetical protein